MNRFKFILPILLAVAACSRDDGGTPGKDGIWAVEMQAGFAGGDVKATQLTRSSKEFTEPFDLFLTQTAPNAGETYLLTPGKYDVTGVGAFTLIDESDNTIYWDDIGGRDAKLSFVAVYPKEVTGLTNIPPGSGGFFYFKVAQDQSEAVGFTASDLLVSKWVEDYTVNTQITATTPIIEFGHVLSKITFVITKSDEFDEDSSKPLLEIIYPFDRKGKVTIPAASGSVSVSDLSVNSGIIKPYTSDNKTFEFVVMPGQGITTAALLAEATVTTKSEATNTYNIYAPSAVTLEPGKDYRFNVTLNKTEGEVTLAVVNDWGTGATLTDDEVGIEVKPGTGTNSGALVDKASFLMSVDGQNTIYTYNINGLKWEDPTPMIYWDDIRRSGELTAKAVLYNKDDLSATPDPEHIYVGQTKAGDLSAAISFINFEKMTHPFARIYLEIKTPTNAENNVDLTKISGIEFNGLIREFASLDIEPISSGSPSNTFQDISYSATTTEITLPDNFPPTEDGDADGYDWFKADPIYIQPVKVEATPAAPAKLLEVTFTDGGLINDYPMTITADADFEADKSYTITLTLLKTEIAEVGIEITGWGTGDGITGDAKIDQ